MFTGKQFADIQHITAASFPVVKSLITSVPPTSPSTPT